MDLVPQDALRQLMELDAQLETTKNNLRELLVPVVQVSNELQKSATNYKTLTDLINKLNVAEKAAGDTYKEQKKVIGDLEKAKKKLADANSEEGKQVAQLREQTRQMNQMNRTAAKEALAHANSLDAMTAKLSRMKQEARGLDVTSQKYKELREEIGKLNAEILREESKMGVWGRNVGNYGSAFNGLRFNIQQVARELPSLTISASQFFLAISNNLPMLADELQRAKEANKAMRAEGKATVPVWKQVLGGIVSWQTALVVGITLLTAYGKEITNWVKGLFGAKQALIETSEITRSFDNNIAKDTAELDIMFAKLKNATKGTEEYDSARMKIIDKYGDYLKGQEDEIRNLENLDEAYKVLTRGIVANSIQKGLQDANSKAIEEYEKRMEKALNGVEEKFIKKFGEEAGYEKFLTFRVGIVSDDEDLRRQAEEIYKEFNYDKTVQNAGGLTNIITTSEVASNSLENVREKIEDANAELQNSQKEIISIQKAYEDVFNLNDEKIDSLIEKQQELRKEAELMPETTEEEIKLKNQRIKQIDDEIKRLQNLGIESEKQAKEREKTEKKQEREEEKLAKYIEKLRLNEINAYNKMQALKLKNGTEANKLIVQDERASYEDRIEALNEYTNALKNSVSGSADAQIDRLIRETGKNLGLNPDNEERAEIEEKVSKQVLYIRAKEAQEIEKIEADSSKMQVKIEEDRVKGIIEAISMEADARQRALTKSESGELGDLAKEYGTGLMSEEQYQRKKKEISDKYTEERFNSEMDMLQKMLAGTLGNEEAMLDIQKRIDDARLEHSKWMNEQEIAEEEKKADRKKQIIQAVAEFADEVSNAYYENQYARLEAEQKANEEREEERLAQIERLEESGAITKEQAEARKQAVMQESELKEKEIAQRQAKLKRQQALTDVAISTAVSIATTAAALGFPAAIPFIAIAAATGAAQIATIKATPIPEYAEGTDDHPGGLAIVGDAGKSEMVIANGRVFKTPDTDTLVELPKHAMVLPDFNYAVEKFPDIPKTERIDLSRLEASSAKLEAATLENNRLLRGLINRMEINARNEIYARELNRLKCSKR